VNFLIAMDLLLIVMDLLFHAPPSTPSLFNRSILYFVVTIASTFCTVDLVAFRLRRFRTPFPSQVLNGMIFKFLVLFINTLEFTIQLHVICLVTNLAGHELDVLTFLSLSYLFVFDVIVFCSQ